MESDKWAEAMNEFRNAVYACQAAGVTAQEMKDDVDEAEADRG